MLNVDTTQFNHCCIISLPCTIWFGKWHKHRDALWLLSWAASWFLHPSHRNSSPGSAAHICYSSTVCTGPGTPSSHGAAPHVDTKTLLSVWILTHRNCKLILKPGTFFSYVPQSTEYSLLSLSPPILSLRLRMMHCWELSMISIDHKYWPR